MNVKIKDLAVEMEVKNKGVEFEVSDSRNKQIGDCIVTKTGLTWCKGKTSASNGVKIRWEKFIEWANEQGTPAKPKKRARAK